MTKTRLHILIDTNLIDRFRRKYVMKKGDLSIQIEKSLRERLFNNKNK